MSSLLKIIYANNHQLKRYGISFYIYKIFLIPVAILVIYFWFKIYLEILLSASNNPIQHIEHFSLSTLKNKDLVIFLVFAMQFELILRLLKYVPLANPFSVLHFL